MTNSQQLLAQYAETGSETAFRELVKGYVDLVYSAAIRLVNGDAHLAEDITQTVFADLARKARSLSREVMLGGWRHRHTCFVASNTLRAERRRQARERQAVEMNSIEDHSAENLARVAPMLDEAINQLGSEDRAAIMLRFFEQNDFRAVGAALGSNEEAARKRVDRALDKLHTSLTRRGVALSVTALGSVLATHAVSAAPIGLAASISGAALAGAAAGGGTTLTLLEIMSMTKLKVGIITAVVVAGVTIPVVMQQRTQTKLAEVNESLRQQTELNRQLTEENERLSKMTARATTPPPASNSPSLEVLRLRGEVGRLRQESAAAQSKSNGPSALSGITANPEMYKVIRDQQKAGLTMIYKDFTNRVKLPPEQSEKLVNLLADDVMTNIDRITEVLREGKSPDGMNQVGCDLRARRGESRCVLDRTGDPEVRRVSCQGHQWKPHGTCAQPEIDGPGRQVAGKRCANALGNLCKSPVAALCERRTQPISTAIRRSQTAATIPTPTFAEVSFDVAGGKAARFNRLQTLESLPL